MEICKLSFVSLVSFSFLSILRTTKHTGRNSHGDGDRGGNRGSQSREAEGFVCGYTGTKGGLLTLKYSSSLYISAAMMEDGIHEQSRSHELRYVES